MTAQWTEVFTNPNFQYANDEYSKKQACADGLMGWAMCMSGQDIPEHFAGGMIKIRSLLGVSATLESLKEYADKNFKN